MRASREVLVFTLALGAILFLVVSRAGNSLAPILAFLAVYALIGIAVCAFTAVEAGHLADGGDPLVSPRAFAWVAAGSCSSRWASPSSSPWAPYAADRMLVG